MNKLAKLVFAASAVVAMSRPKHKPTSRQAPHIAHTRKPVNGVDRSQRSTGLCWRTGYWTPADAVPGCDGALAVAAAAPAAAAPAAAAPVPTSEKVTFAADAFFDFDKAVLKPDGKAKLDDLASKLGSLNLEVIIAVGHTDSVGSDAYNQKLSIRRAEAVKRLPGW
jgi:OOP family OmpA-OmpF porin